MFNKLIKKCLILNISSVDNRVGIFTLVMGPSSKSHVAENKYSKVQNNILVGHSASFNCILDQFPDDINTQNSLFPAASFSTSSGGFIGIVEGGFVDGSNKAPMKAW